MTDFEGDYSSSSNWDSDRQHIISSSITAVMVFDVDFGTVWVFPDWDSVRESDVTISAGRYATEVTFTIPNNLLNPSMEVGVERFPEYKPPAIDYDEIKSINSRFLNHLSEGGCSTNDG